MRNFRRALITSGIALLIVGFAAPAWAATVTGGGWVDWSTHGAYPEFEKCERHIKLNARDEQGVPGEAGYRPASGTVREWYYFHEMGAAEKQIRSFSVQVFESYDDVVYLAGPIAGDPEGDWASVRIHDGQVGGSGWDKADYCDEWLVGSEAVIRESVAYHYSSLMSPTEWTFDGGGISIR